MESIVFKINELNDGQQFNQAYYNNIYRLPNYLTQEPPPAIINTFAEKCISDALNNVIEETNYNSFSLFLTDEIFQSIQNNKIKALDKSLSLFENNLSKKFKYNLEDDLNFNNIESTIVDDIGTLLSLLDQYNVNYFCTVVIEKDSDDKPKIHFIIIISEFELPKHPANQFKYNIFVTIRLETLNIPPPIHSLFVLGAFFNFITKGNEHENTQNKSCT